MRDIYFLSICFIFILILNVPSCIEPMCQRNISILMLCILMNNKD